MPGRLVAPFLDFIQRPFQKSPAPELDKYLLQYLLVVHRHSAQLLMVFGYCLRIRRKIIFLGLMRQQHVDDAVSVEGYLIPAVKVTHQVGNKQVVQLFQLISNVLFGKMRKICILLHIVPDRCGRLQKL